MINDRYTQHTYVIRRKVLSLFGSKFYVQDPAGRTLMFCRKKRLKLKEDIRIFTGEDEREQVIAIRARSMIDFGATYDVVDSTTNERVGALRRRGFKSILKDEWIILDTEDREVGTIKEDSLLFAMIRRVVTGLVPQTFAVSLNGQAVAEFRQHFNPFIQKLTLDFSKDQAGALDRRLAIAAGLLLCIIEGRQD